MQKWGRGTDKQVLQHLCGWRGQQTLPPPSLQPVRPGRLFLNIL